MDTTTTLTNGAHPPLDSIVTKDGQHIEVLPHVEELASEKGAKSASQYIERLKNKRNQVLYAANSGIPKVDDAKSYVTYRQSVFVSHIVAYLLIEQWQQQKLVQYGLSSFLKLLGKVPREK